MSKNTGAKVAAGGCLATGVVAAAVGGGILAIMSGAKTGDNGALCRPESVKVTFTGEPPKISPYSQKAIENAAVIMTIGEQLKIPARGQLVALMTAMQESQLGDDKSAFTPDENGDAGVFQQRQIPGWYGTLAEVNDVATAARNFYTGKTVEKSVPGGAGPDGYHIPGLTDIKGWEQLALTVAAQRVQVSAFPSAYAKHEAKAREIMSALSGQNFNIDTSQPGAAICTGSEGIDAALAGTGSIADVIAVARSTLGTNYRLGSGGYSGPTGGSQDCSGLTTYSYAKGAGIRLPRTARGQWAALRSNALTPDKIQPGDLIFEAWGRLGKTVSHVTIYIGDGKQIEASRTAGQTRISDARFSGYQFVGIARVPKDFKG